MNPCAQATIRRAAGSARSGPASSAIVRKKVAEERMDRALPPGAPACAVNMSEYVTGLAWANLR
jgi:hypothetical protein